MMLYIKITKIVCSQDEQSQICDASSMASDATVANTAPQQKIVESDHNESSTHNETKKDDHKEANASDDFLCNTTSHECNSVMNAHESQAQSPTNEDTTQKCNEQ